MSLRLLLDEHISPAVAEQVRAKAPGADVESIFAWRGRAFVGAPDDRLLAALREEGRTLVTFDTQMLSEWGFLFTGAAPFAGVLFVDGRSISPSDLGGLVRALLQLWEQEKEADWADRIAFLRPAPAGE
jgi:hypothetical protein